MAKVKCAYCHTEIDKKNAIAKQNGGRNKYYCCPEHVGLANENEIYFINKHKILWVKQQAVFSIKK